MGQCVTRSLRGAYEGAAFDVAAFPAVARSVGGVGLFYAAVDVGALVYSDLPWTVLGIGETRPADLSVAVALGLGPVLVSAGPSRGLEAIGIPEPARLAAGMDALTPESPTQWLLALGVVHPLGALPPAARDAPPYTAGRMSPGKNSSFGVG